MPAYTSPEIVVQRQLDAYNAKNLEALLATYAPQAQMFEHPAKLLATGHAEIRARQAARFAEGPGSMEMIAMYVVGNGLIQSASFIFGPPCISASADKAKKASEYQLAH